MPNKRRLPRLPSDLAGIVPVVGPDDRQEGLLRSLKREDKLLANLARGFPASCPDLGFLQYLAFAAHNGSGMPPKDALKAVVGHSVQRVEVINITKSDEHPNEYRVMFTTHDDYGGYRYTFSVDFDTDYRVPNLVEKIIHLNYKNNKKKKEAKEDEE